MGPGLKKGEENEKKKAEDLEETDKHDDAMIKTEFDPSEIINKFYCSICEYVNNSLLRFTEVLGTY